MKIEDIEQIQRGAAIIVMLRTSAAWGEKWCAPALGNRVAVELLAELIETALKLDGYGAGEVGRAGFWKACMIAAPVHRESLQAAKSVVEKIVEKAVTAESVWVAALGVEGEPTPDWTLERLADFAECFGAQIEAVKERQKVSDQIESLHRRIDELERDTREGDQWKRSDEDDQDGGEQK